MIQRCAILAALAGLGQFGVAQSQRHLTKVDMNPLMPGAREVAIDAPRDTTIAAGSRLLVAADGAPRAWAQLVEQDARQARFRFAAPLDHSGNARGWTGWLVPPDLAARLLPQWPAGAELEAEVGTLGPGGSTVWLRAGSNDGIGVGDTWWHRVGGQPAARLQVRLVTPELSFCNVVALASEPALREGSRVTLWPAPWERRTGRARSAVAFIEPRGENLLVWVAAPPASAYPPEPHVDFYHGGRYAGYGVVERRDERFWYARLLPLEGFPRPQVGDDAVIRTQRDLDEHRLVAHVFEVRAEGALVNAGETDGLLAGQTLFVQRAGQAVGRATVRSVEATYALVVAAPEGGVEPLPLRAGDELRLTLRPAVRTVVGTIEEVGDGDSPIGGFPVFRARTSTSPTPVEVPLVVESGGATVGVAILIADDGNVAIGFALTVGRRGALARGMDLVRITDPG